MAREAPEPPFSEPEIVPCLWTSGLALEINDTVVRIVGWATMPHLGGEMDERRICIRFAMANVTARKLAEELRRGLSRGAH